ncbi:MAG: NUDIX hydrolase [Lachnospiraceae bacterium]|nr:NUDIX hydrolase [Lachnospiraceae bacterium]
MDYELHRVGRELVYEGAALDFYKDLMELPGGKREYWEFVHHKRAGGACAVPVLRDGRILLVRQFRPCAERETLELPAGARLGPDEDSALTVVRELEEETGYTCDRVELLVRLQTSVAWCDESTDVYLAKDLRPLARGQNLDEAEEIGVEAFALEDLLDRIARGQIRDAKTVAGLLAYAAGR